MSGFGGGTSFFSASNFGSLGGSRGGVGVSHEHSIF